AHAVGRQRHHDRRRAVAAWRGAAVHEAAHELGEVAHVEGGVLHVVGDVVGPRLGGGPAAVVAAGADRVLVLVVDRLSRLEELDGLVYSRHARHLTALLESLVEGSMIAAGGTPRGVASGGRDRRPHGGRR